MVKQKSPSEELPLLIDFDEIGEDKHQHMRKILKNYKELNKLYDLCLKKIETRSELKKR